MYYNTDSLCLIEMSYSKYYVNKTNSQPKQLFLMCRFAKLWYFSFAVAAFFLLWNIRGWDAITGAAHISKRVEHLRALSDFGLCTNQPQFTASICPVVAAWQAHLMALQHTSSAALSAVPALVLAASCFRRLRPIVWWTPAACLWVRHRRSAMSIKPCEYDASGSPGNCFR